MKKIVVIGGGTMGLDIAQVFAKKGFDVVVRDINDDIIKASEARLNKGLDKLVAKGKLDEAGLEEYENNACPTCGSCSGMYTANSMNCLTEPSAWGCGATAPSPPCGPPACGWPSTPACRSWSWWSGISVPGTS